MTSRAYWMNAVVDDETVCNAIGAAVDPGTGGGRTWQNATKLYPFGTVFVDGGPINSPAADNPSTARLVSVPLTETGFLLFSEFNTAGPFPRWNALGFDDATVAEYKQRATIETGARNVTEPNWRQFVESLGYTIPGA